MQDELAVAATLAAVAVRWPDLFPLAHFVRVGLYQTTSGARRAVVRGEWGAFARVGRRIFLRREGVLEALKKREYRPPDTRSPRKGDPARLDALRKAWPLPGEIGGEGGDR